MSTLESAIEALGLIKQQAAQLTENFNATQLDTSLNGTEAAERTAYRDACSTVCPYCAGKGLHYTDCADRKRAAIDALQPLLFADTCATCGAVGQHPYADRCKACVIAEDVVRRRSVEAIDVD